jgi:trans-aconitate 2-methyltransferase
MSTTSHSWNPADYARHSTGQERWARELIGLLHLKPDDSVLDIGCGDGRMTAEIAKLVPRGGAVGVDKSSEMVAFARERFSGADFPNLSFQQADAAALPFSEEFSVIFSNAALHWVKGHRPVLAGIAGSLRPGGRCALQMGGQGNGADMIRAFDDCRAQARWRKVAPELECPYGFYSPEEYREWIAEAGLTADEVALVGKDMVHATHEAFVGWLRTSWMPYFADIPEADVDEFLTDVSARFLQIHPLDDLGWVHVPMVRLLVLAHKRG